MKETTTYINHSLKGFYPPEEIRFITRIIFFHVCRLSYNQQILCKDTQIPEKEKTEIHAIVKRLQKMEPLQYILEESEFYSLPFKVNRSVLIPRPETEELADMIIKSQPGNASRFTFRILDIGTGSGCIAITLAKHLPHTRVTAVELSEAAIETAQINARLNQVDIHFIQTDILDTREAMQKINGYFNIIVSNPPYIKKNEKTTMNPNVLDYEPHDALFVPDNDPLRFYIPIADFAAEKLHPKGMLYFEINPQCDTIITEMLHQKGFSQVYTNRDLSGKNRFITAQKQL